MSNGNPATGADGYALGVGNGNYRTSGTNLLGVASGVTWLDFGIAIGSGWHMVTMTRDATTWRGYVDGVQGPNTFTSNPNAPTVGFNVGLLIGQYAASNADSFTGGIANVILHRRALRQSEIARLARDPWAGTARNTRRTAYRPPVAYTLDPQPVAYRYTPANVALTYEPAQTGDTHDGFKRRSRRQRAADAAEQKRRVTLAQEAVALRLELEAAMGMAAEAVEEAPAAAAQAVQTAAKAARVAVPAVPDMEGLAAARAAVAALLEAVEEARRAKALAEDDEEVFMLLRAL